MKFAILSDIHSNLEALNAVLEYCRKENVDKYICVGDIVGYNANPLECLKIVQDLKPIAIVRGNHDDYVGTDQDLVGFNPFAKAALLWNRAQLNQEQRNWLKKLPLKDVIIKEGITVVHATLDTPSAWGYILDEHHAKDNFSYQVTRLCFCGHSHIPLLFKRGETSALKKNIFKSTRWEFSTEEKSETSMPVRNTFKYLVNVGSIGQPRNSDPRASFVIYDSREKRIKRVCVKYDIKMAQQKIIAAGLPSLLAERLAIGL